MKKFLSLIFLFVNALVGNSQGFNSVQQPADLLFTPVSLSPSQEEEYPMSKFAISLNPLGFAQFGPIVSAEFGLSDKVVLNTHLRFSSLGALSYLINYDVDGLDELGGIAFGGGPLYFFGERKSKAYIGVLLEYGRETLLYAKEESYEWEEKHNTIVFMFNAGYRFRFAEGIFINTGGYFGAASTNWVWDYTDHSYGTGTDGKSITPFGMLEVTVGIEF